MKIKKSHAPSRRIILSVFFTRYSLAEQNSNSIHFPPSSRFDITNKFNFFIFLFHFYSETLFIIYINFKLLIIRNFFKLSPKPKPFKSFISYFFSNQNLRQSNSPNVPKFLQNIPNFRKTFLNSKTFNLPLFFQNFPKFQYFQRYIPPYTS